MEQTENNLQENEVDEEARQYIIKESKNGDNISEKIIVIFAYIILCLGILLCIVYTLLLENFLFFFVGIPSCLFTWALLLCFANISTNIRTIKHIILKKNQY